MLKQMNRRYPRTGHDRKLSLSEIDDIAPGGMEFLALLRRYEDNCEQQSLSRIPEFGVKLPQLFEKLGDVLRLADAVGSCLIGCAGGGHEIERMICNICSHARGGIRLALLGFYDEALVLARSVGEYANLLTLFSRVPGEYDKWLRSTEKRFKEFKAIDVRMRLEKAGFSCPVPEARYKALSGKGVHPGGIPQEHSVPGQGCTGGFFQTEGLMVCMNEVGRSLAIAFACAIKMLDHLSVSEKEAMREYAVRLLENVGSVDIVGQQEVRLEIKKQDQKEEGEGEVVR